jgi:hypothetical protein
LDIYKRETGAEKNMNVQKRKQEKQEEREQINRPRATDEQMAIGQAAKDG